MQVIGKRHFGRKALAPGGGGGRATARELFDTLLLWRARVPLDDDGNATVEIPLNDSLTSFRIVAVASSGAELFGTGEASIRVDAGLDGAVRAAAAGARRRPLPRDVHGAQRERSARTNRRARRARWRGAALPAQKRDARARAGARARSGTSTAPQTATSARVARRGRERDRRRSGADGRCAQGRAEGRAGGARAHVPGDDPAAHAAAVDSRCSGRPMRFPGAAASTCRCRRSSRANCPGVRDYLRALSVHAASSSARRSRSACSDRARWDAADGRAARLSRSRRARSSTGRSCATATTC